MPPYDFLLQNAAGCWYSEQTVPPCLGYHADEWMTFQIHVAIGTWYKNDQNYHQDSKIADPL